METTRWPSSSTAPYPKPHTFWDSTNGLFAQATYCRDRGLALNLSRDPFQAQLRFYSQRAVEVMRIFESVLPPERLVRVMGSQMNPWVSEQVLGWGAARSHIDALAVAPYFNFRPDEQATAATLSLDGLFAAIDDALLPRVRDGLRGQAAVARRYGVRLVGYEGGQHLVGTGPYQNNLALNALYNAANRDPRMGSRYTRMLEDWNSISGDILLHFTHCSAYGTGASGRFGSLESMDQPRDSAPKYDALQRWIEGR